MKNASVNSSCLGKQLLLFGTLTIFCGVGLDDVVRSRGVIVAVGVKIQEVVDGVSLGGVDVDGQRLLHVSHRGSNVDDPVPLRQLEGPVLREGDHEAFDGLLALALGRVAVQLVGLEGVVASRLVGLKPLNLMIVPYTS